MKAIIEMMLLKSLNPMWVGNGTETEWDRLSEEERKELSNRVKMESIGKEKNG